MRHIAEIESEIEVRKVLAVFGSAFIGAAFLTFGSDCFIWLKTGIWASTTVWGALGWLVAGNYPNVEWRGLQKMIDWFLFLPLSLPTLVIGIYMTGTALRSLGESEKEVATIRRQQDLPTEP
jgi:ABC-type sulfate transport system permease component